MKLIHDLPDALCKKIEKEINKDPYNIKNEPDAFRVTALIGSPLPRTLLRKYRDSDQLVVKASFFLPMIFGTIFHELCKGKDDDTVIYESPINMIIEQDNEQYLICGTPDEIRKGEKLIDNKTAVVMNLNYPTREEYIYQLNIYRFMLEEADVFDAKGMILELRYFLKDWSANQAARGGDYPKSQIQYKQVPVMSVIDVSEYIKHRIRDHTNNPDRLCTPEERNLGKVAYKVYMPGRIKAKLASYRDEKGKRCDIETLGKAQELMAGLPAKDRAKAYIEKITEDMKCRHYCMVRSVCPYAQENHYAK